MLSYSREEISNTPGMYNRSIEFNLFPFNLEICVKIKVGCKFKNGKVFTEEWAEDITKAVKKVNSKCISAIFWNETLRLTISI